MVFLFLKCSQSFLHERNMPKCISTKHDQCVNLNDCCIYYSLPEDFHRNLKVHLNVEISLSKTAGNVPSSCTSHAKHLSTRLDTFSTPFIHSLRKYSIEQLPPGWWHVQTIQFGPRHFSLKEGSDPENPETQFL